MDRKIHEVVVEPFFGTKGLLLFVVLVTIKKHKQKPSLPGIVVQVSMYNGLQLRWLIPLPMIVVALLWLPNGHVDQNPL